MKLAVLTPRHFEAASPAGAQRWPLNLAAGLAEAGGGRISVELVASDVRAWRRQTAPGLTLTALAAPRVGGPTWELAGVMDGADAVVVDDALSPFGTSALVAAAHARRPCVAALRGGYPDPRDGHGAAIALAGAVIHRSDAERSRAPGGDAAEVIPGGVDSSFFSPPAVPGDRDIAVFAGRLSPEKGIDQLVAALPPRVGLVICGPCADDAYRERVEDLARVAGARVAGVVDDVALRDLFRRAYAVVLPSVHLDHRGIAHPVPEWTALALLEGMACGAAAVCTRVGPLPELVEDGVSGVICDTPEAAAEELDRLRREPERAARLGAAARAAVVERYDRAVLGTRVAALIRRLERSRR